MNNLKKFTALIVLILFSLTACNSTESTENEPEIDLKGFAKYETIDHRFTVPFPETWGVIDSRATHVNALGEELTYNGFIERYALIPEMVEASRSQNAVIFYIVDETSILGSMNISVTEDVPFTKKMLRDKSLIAELDALFKSQLEDSGELVDEISSGLGERISFEVTEDTHIEKYGKNEFLILRYISQIDGVKSDSITAMGFVDERLFAISYSYPMGDEESAEIFTKMLSGIQNEITLKHFNVLLSNAAKRFSEEKK